MTVDPHRPTFHFSPDLWMNDPIPFFDKRDGTYHVFFQHNPNNPFWGDMTWGHALSRDLVRWERLPDAIHRTPGGPDAEGVWTGCVVRGDDGVFNALYTGIPTNQPFTQVQCRARSRDLTSWEKPPPNPVISTKPAGYGDCFRDPHVWRESDGWYMVIGSELPDKTGGAALLYRSDDLVKWTYLHPLVTGDARQTNFDFECPDFFPLGDARHVLLSSRVHTFWQSGAYDAVAHRFKPAAYGKVDTDVFYAAKTLLDARGRRILFGWVQERRPREEQLAAGWSGVLSLPRVMTMGDDGVPHLAPPDELEALRGRHIESDPPPPLGGDSQTVRTIDGVGGTTIELVVRFAPGTARTFGLRVRASPDGASGTDVLYDRAAGTLCGVPFTLPSNEPLTLRVLVDSSVVEAFANDRACRTLRTYAPSEHAHVAMIVEAGELEVRSLDVWEVRPRVIDRHRDSVKRE